MINHPEYLTKADAWLSEVLPRQQTFTLCDIDKVVWNHQTNRLMLIELKCRMADPTAAQRKLFRFLTRAVSRQCREEGIEWLGYHLIQFEREVPTDGGVTYWDRKAISTDELLSRLRMDPEAEDREVAEAVAIAKSF